MILEIALLSPIYVTFFWSIVFYIQKGGQDKPKTQLGLFMLMAFIFYCTNAVFFSNLFHLYAYIEGVYVFTLLSLYPLYYIYILKVTTVKINTKSLSIHFLPAIIFGILSLITTLFLTEEQRILYVQDTLINKNLRGLNWSSPIGIKGHISLISKVAILIQIVFYVFYSIKLAISHNKRVSNYFSNVDGKMLNWIRNLNIVIIVIAIASIVFTLIGRSYFARNEISNLIPSAIFSFILFVIGFKGNQQVQIREEIIENKELEVEETKTTPDEELKTHLIELFESKKIYKDSNLRITTVSESLKTNRTYISRLINDEFNINFNEYVNKYRVKEAKKLLDNKDNSLYTMEHIAEKSGFGSVNSFSRAFKEFEGITPGKFKNKNI